MPDDQLTAAEVAEILCCTSNHVRSLWDCGRLPGVDIGTGKRRVLRFSRMAVQQLIKPELVAEAQSDNE